MCCVLCAVSCVLCPVCCVLRINRPYLCSPLLFKITGFVNATDTYTDHPKVINGCSELFIKVFPEAVSGHARAAVGVNSLPLGVPVEIEMIVELFPPVTSKVESAAPLPPLDPAAVADAAHANA